MLYAFVCRDKPNSVALRMNTRPVHLTYLEGQGRPLLLAGPLLAGDGQTPIGSLLIVDCASQADAEAFAGQDPYALAGLFESVDITPFRKTLSA